MRDPHDGDTAPTWVDLVFPLAGHSLPRDHHQALAQALEAVAPWLADEPGAGAHPVKLVPASGDPALLSPRSRLLVRLPRRRVPDLARLQGCTLVLDGHRLRLGVPHVRELVAHNTLFAHLVAADAEGSPGTDEAAFLARTASELDALGARCQQVCGRPQRIRVQADSAAPRLAGYSLMLHGLLPAHARLVLEAGLGPHRRLGCGVFVAHRSAAAVGA